MTSNLDKFKNDIERLIHEGDHLLFSMKREIMGDKKFKAQIESQLNEAQVKLFMEKLPYFSSAYERWYSESLALIRQLLPDRVSDFRSLYEKPKSRKEISYGNYVMQDYLQGLRVTFGGETKVDISAALPQFQQQLNIVKAASARFESSLFDIRQIVQADLFDGEVDAARMLLKNGFLRAAGAVAGVVVEKHLKQVCKDRGILLQKKNPGIGDLNEALKNASVIDIPQWRKISFLADVRNICDHSKGVEPSKDQVQELIDGTSGILKNII